MDNQKLYIPTVELIKEGGDDYEFLSLEGIIELPSWKDFSRKTGQFGSAKRVDDYKHIRLSIGGDEVLENPAIRLEHVSAYEYVLQNQEKIKTNVLNALLSEYPSLQEQYGYDDDDALEIMPDVYDVALFADLIELSSVYILNVSKQGVAYVGFSFQTTWDDEHGLGIMTHQDKVVEIGGADTAFLTWIAERDLNPEKVNAEIASNYRLAEENFNQTLKEKTKPWWKFW